MKPSLRQDQITKKLNCSSSTLQRHRNVINMLTPYKHHPNNTNKRSRKFSNANIDNNLLCEHGHKRPQFTSKDFKRPQMTSNDPEIKLVKIKNKLKSGSKIEISENYLDENVHNNYL